VLEYLRREKTAASFFVWRLGRLETGGGVPTNREKKRAVTRDKVEDFLSGDKFKEGPGRFPHCKPARLGEG